MVEAGRPANIAYRVKKADFFADSRLGIKPEYFECPICMCMLPNILECPRCHARSCDDCLTSFSGQKRGVTEQDKMTKNLPCTQCHEKV